MHLHLDRSKAGGLQSEAGHAGYRERSPNLSKPARLSFKPQRYPFFFTHKKAGFCLTAETITSYEKATTALLHLYPAQRRLTRNTT